MTVSRRRLLLAFAIVLTAGPAFAAAPARPGLSETDAQDVARAVAYLEGLTTAKWRFTQSDTRGGRLSGSLILQRPGRARFDYDPPSGMVVASDGHRVAIVDRRLKTIQAYPLGMTPLGLFLGRNIRFDRGVRVKSVDRTAEGLTILAVEAQHRDRGSIALNFSSSPFSLTGWTLTDGRGVKVQVRLSDFSKVGPQDPKTFELADPAPRPETGGIH
jgi:outer membrane lipoprotein-sorting protein